MLDFSSQSQEKKVETLEGILQTLEQHLQVSRAFFARKADAAEGSEALLELYQQAYDEALALKERAQAGDDDEERWYQFLETYGTLGRALERTGERNWLALGPTTSRRLNQFLYFCFGKRAVKSTLERKTLGKELETLIATFLQQLEEGPLYDSLKTVEARIGEILDYTTPNFDPQVKKLLAAVRDLSELMNLADLDQNTKPEKSWLENFRHLVEAVLLGEVEVDYLYRERDLAIERVQALLPATYAADAPDELSEVLMELGDHLALLEQALANDEDFQDWDAALGEMWEELEELNQQAQTAPSTSCAVCGGSLPEGAERCPMCNAPILNLDQAQVQEAPSGPSATGSTLLDQLLDSWEGYCSGTVSEEALRQKFGAVERKIKGALKASSRAPEGQGPAPAVSQALEKFGQQLEQFGGANSAEFQARWAGVLGAGEELIGSMMAHG